jgi:hypothetical protein
MAGLVHLTPERNAGGITHSGSMDQSGPDDLARAGGLFTRLQADRRPRWSATVSAPARRSQRTLHGIDEQITKAEQAVVGRTAVKRNRFLKLTGAAKSVNRTLETKARALAGIKGYVTNLQACPDGTPITADFVIGAYHRLFEIEKSFRMSKHDLQARPIYHHKRESIEAHLNIVFAALALTRWVEATTGCSIRRFVQTARRYRTITVQAGQHTITAADPASADLQTALDLIYGQQGAH